MPPTIEVLQVKRMADKSPEALAAHPPDHPDKYPSAGLDVCDTRGHSAEPPKLTRVSTNWVDRGVQEGWIELVNDRPVMRPGGPATHKWRRDKVHVFLHADEIVLKTHDGRPDVRYKVIHQPDKYVDERTWKAGEREYPPVPTPADDERPVTDELYAEGLTRVDWFYDLELLEA